MFAQVIESPCLEVVAAPFVANRDWYYRMCGELEPEELELAELEEKYKDMKIVKARMRADYKEKALIIGEQLVAAKERAGNTRGAWTKWLADNFPKDASTARRYMSLVKAPKTEVEEVKPVKVKAATLNSALKEAPQVAAQLERVATEAGTSIEQQIAEILSHHFCLPTEAPQLEVSLSPVVEEAEVVSALPAPANVLPFLKPCRKLQPEEFEFVPDSPPAPPTMPEEEIAKHSPSPLSQPEEEQPKVDAVKDSGLQPTLVKTSAVGKVEKVLEKRAMGKSLAIPDKVLLALHDSGSWMSVLEIEEVAGIERFRKGASPAHDALSKWVRAGVVQKKKEGGIMLFQLP